MKRVFIDTNVVLDFLLEREPFVENAVKLFAKIDAGEIIGFIAATTITNIYYIIRFFGSFYGKPGSKPLKALLCRHFIENMVIIVYNPCPVRVLL